MARNTETGPGAAVVVLVIVKIFVLIFRVAPDIARAVPPPRAFDDVVLARPASEVVGQIPDVVNVMTLWPADDE